MFRVASSGVSVFRARASDVYRVVWRTRDLSTRIVTPLVAISPGRERERERRLVRSFALNYVRLLVGRSPGQDRLVSPIRARKDTFANSETLHFRSGTEISAGLVFR